MDQMDQLNHVLDAGEAALNRIRRVSAAAAYLRCEADCIAAEKIARMLCVCADALPDQGDPAHLCRENYRRLFESLGDAETLAKAEIDATDVHLGALAFEAAARLIEGE
jgi:hypothetical protein